ncbi:hypothetical protein SCHPADRAFT_909016 [Schizopora paradoxa]|uniref:Uncharacterized protein n=1 Tax=Schizopora paradoxa TaxID=27342 RepID=A0A0H2R7Z4_9AGAM|nr:hypothetical protein SCHPADRAFT_909016 [Schizopora paradoxa]
MSTVPNFDVLPPEIIEIVFDHTLQCIPAETRSLQALACSHVCRSFRRVALNSPTMWRCLPVLSRKGQSHVNTQFIEACVKRSRGLPLDGFLYFYLALRNPDGHLESDPSKFLVDGTFETTLLHCARWRSCSLKLIYDDDIGSNGIYLPFLDFRELFVTIDAPLLEELSFGASHDLELLGIFSTLTNAHFAWNIPKLRAFNMTNTLSLPSSKYRALLHSLTVNFHQVEFTHHIGSLRSRMRGLRSLSTVELSFIECCFSIASFYSLAEMPSITTLGITLLACTQTPTYRHLLWHDFRTFYFPNLVELHITLDIEDRDDLVIWNGYNIALFSFVAPTMRADCEPRYPSLETLVVTVQPRMGSPSPQSGQTPFPKLLLPCCCIPSLKHFRIRSTQSWVLSDSIVGGDVSLEHPRVTFIERGEQVVAINLQTVTFEVPQIDGIVPWVRKLTSNMQDTGCWDRFSKLTVVQSGEAVVIPRDEIERWCETK